MKKFVKIIFEIKRVYLLFTLLFFCINLMGQEEITNSFNKNLADKWSGRYRLEIRNGDTVSKQPLVFVKIRQTEDINPEYEAARYKSDLKRWIISTEGTDDEVIMRRFFFDLEDGRNEYEQFGWTDLHKEGEMECIDAGHFFICKTTPNTTVDFGDDETAFTESGIFGIRLHLGLFELYEVGE